MTVMYFVAGLMLFFIAALVGFAIMGTLWLLSEFLFDNEK